MTRTRSVIPALSAAVLLFALTACGGGGGDDPTASSSPSASESPTAEASPSSSPSEEPAPVTAPPCTRNSIKGEYIALDGTAGHLHGVLKVTNMVDAPCSLSGYPTVYVGEPGIATTIGAAATLDPNDPGVPLDLAKGESAVAAITIVQAGNIDGCVQIDTDTLLYAPPGQPFDLEVSAQNVTMDFYVACRDDNLSLMTVGGFKAE